jgi:hypothetical protein
MANDFITPVKIVSEALMHLENELMLAKSVHTDLSDEFTTVGDTVNMRRPAQYTAQLDDLDVSSTKQDIQQATVPVTMQETITVPVEISAIHRTLSFDRFSEDVVKPAMITIRDQIEKKISARYIDFYHFAGTPGTVPATFKAVGALGSILTDGAVPMDMRRAFHPTDTGLELADGVKSLYIEGKNKKALERASIGEFAGFENFTSVYAPSHTVGTHGGTPLVNGADQDTDYADVKTTWSQTLVTNGWTNSTTNVLRAGDVITIDGVFAVNPVSKVSTGRLQTFTVKANANSGASTGPATLTISPPIITSGPFQTVTAAPANDAPITVKTGTAGATYRQSLMLHPKAIALVSRRLNIPASQGVKTAYKAGNSVSISCTEYVKGDDLSQTIRFDVLCGVTTIDPRLGGRLTA